MPRRAKLYDLPVRLLLSTSWCFVADADRDVDAHPDSYAHCDADHHPDSVPDRHADKHTDSHPAA